MTGALMQDQWEAMQESTYDFFNHIWRQSAIVPPGFVPVPPSKIRNWIGVELMSFDAELKEDE